MIEGSLNPRDRFNSNEDEKNDEVELPQENDDDDIPDWQGGQKAQGKVSKKICLKGGERSKGGALRSLDCVAEQLRLDHLVVETKKTLHWIRGQRQPQAGRTRFEDWEEDEVVRIKGYTSISMRYPAVHDSTKAIQEYARLTESYLYMRNKNWAKSRYDTVLIRYEQSEGDHTMANRRVARLLLLFSTECPVTATTIELAYVQLFRLVGTGPDPCSDMFKVRKDKYAVIEIDTIERGCHLIPSYSGFATPMASGRSLPSLDAYEDFSLNNYIDEHMYNTIYNADRWT